MHEGFKLLPFRTLRLVRGGIFSFDRCWRDILDTSLCGVVWCGWEDRVLRGDCGLEDRCLRGKVA